MSLYWKMGWRDARQRPGRAILTLLSVVIGVGAVVAVTLATGTTRNAFDEIYHTIAGRAGLEVTAPVGTSFDEKVIDVVSEVPGVQAAAPLIQRRSVMYIHDRRVQIVTLGVDPARDRAIHDFDIVEGKYFDNGNVVMLDAAFARNVGAKLDDEVELLTRRGIVKQKVVAIYTTKGTATTGQAAALLLPLKTAQNVFKTPRKVDSIQLVLDPAADDKKIEAAVLAKLPQGLSVKRPAARSPMATETAMSTEQGMSMARAFSLLVAVFIIANTFLINVAQRRRQLGIMRAIGATRRQIAWLMYTEALLMGILGTILGSALGVIGARYLNNAMGQLYNTDLSQTPLTPFPFILGGVFGLGISLLGAALPARKASHLSPMEAMRAVLPDDIEGVSRWLVWFGILLVIICSFVMAAAIVGWLPVFNSVWAAIIMLTGMVLILPAGLSALSSIVSRILRPWIRVEGQLAHRQLLRHRSRTTLTIGVVFVAVSTGIGLASSVIDNVNDVKDWYRKTIVADFFVRAMAPDMATGLAADLPDEIGPQLKETPGLTKMDTMRFISANAAGVPSVVIIRDYTDSSLQQFDLEDGDPDAVRQSLRDGNVVLGSVLSERTKLKAGDDITLDSDKGEQKFHITAVSDDYQAGGLTMYMQTEVAKEKLGVEGVDAYVLKVDHTKLTEAREWLQKLCDENGLLLQSFSDIQRHIDGMMSGVVASLWAMVVLGLVVAAFGVANTLTMNVLEQTRELGLLRVLAMTRGQVRKTIFAQAMMMGLLALVPGIVAGVVVAYLINLSTMSVTGHPVHFVVHPELLGGGLLVGLLIVAGAAWFPAERAARLDLPEALSLV